MKKLLFIFSLYILSGEFILGQYSYKGQIDSSKVPKLQQHYQEEYSYDVILDTLKWIKEKPGLNVSFASTNKHYFRSEVPDLDNKTTLWEDAGWKGERLNALILVWSPDTINQVRFKLENLINSNRKTLDNKNIKISTVHYVLSNYAYDDSAMYCASGSETQAYLMPDRLTLLNENSRFDLPARNVRPVWISVDIPQDAETGLYQGNIIVSSEEFTYNLSLKLDVQDMVLPKPKEWKHRLDLWQNPWVVAWYYHLEPWSEEHKSLLKKHLQLYADAGGTFITTYAVYSPWSDNSYMIEGTMVEWIKQKDGAWKFDYDIFDQYVQLAMEAEVNEAITIYTPLPWGNRFRYLDEKTGNYVYESWAPDSNIFNTVWNIFLDDLKHHLIEKGWFEKTYLGINENELSQTLAAIKVIKDNSDKWKITYAGNWHEELDLLLDDYCFQFGNESSLSQVKERSSRGFTTTYYVCCTPPKPNNFVFSPPAEGRWLGWYTAAHGYDGFLRWAYDAWTQDPLRDARHTFWPAGDCFLVYPGGSSSIRYEKLREGIVDYEKIRILRELISKSSNEITKNLIQEFEQYLLTFLEQKDFNEVDVIKSLDKGKRFLKELTNNYK